MRPSSSCQRPRRREPPLWRAAGGVARAAIKLAQSLEDSVDADGSLQARRGPQGGTGGNRGSVGSPGGQNRAFLGQGQVRMRYHVPGMPEDGARMQQRLEIEYVVVGGGRRPHVFLHSMTSGAAARQNEVGPARGLTFR